MRMMMPVRMPVIAAWTMHMFLHMMEIGTAFRVERRIDRHDFCAKAARHVLQGGVPANPEAPWQNLDGEVAIAEKPGYPRQFQRIGATDFCQCFWGRNHLHQPPVLQTQGVAAAQRNRLRQIQQKCQAAKAGQGRMLAMALSKIQHDGICGGSVPCTMRLDLGSAGQRRGHKLGFLGLGLRGSCCQNQHHKSIGKATR